MKLYTIKRSKKWIKQKFGILLGPPAPKQRTLLQNNPIIKNFADDDRFLQIIFNMCDIAHKEKHLRLFAINKLTGEFKPTSHIHAESQLINWKCAVCDIPILSDMNDFSPYNFCCTECRSKISVRKKLVDSRIAKNSLLFATECKAILQKQQKAFLKYSRYDKIKIQNSKA